MPPMEVMKRFARFTDLGDLFPDAPYGGHEEVGQVYLGELFPDAPYGGHEEVGQVY